MKHYKILFPLLICSLGAFSQEDHWDVYLAQYEKGVGSTIINMSLKKHAPMPQYPYLLKTGIKLIKCSPDGLPEKEEFNIIDQISDRIKAVIDSTLKNIAAATFSYQCERFDYYYVTDTAVIRKHLELTYQKEFPDYKYAISFWHDKNWEAYLTFLYPNDEIYEYMTNDKVIMNLTQAGDDLSKSRQVDHWLYFKTEADRDKFIIYVSGEKYKVESKQINEHAELKYQLQISRTDKVDISSISKITLALRKKAKEMNGNYDGWETFVITPK